MKSVPLQPGAAPRERILETALRLFYANGIRAVGIDRIIAESEVAKASFYRHFPSKDDLVVAFLRLRHDRWMAWFTQGLEAACAARGPAFERVAELLLEWFEEPSFRGCAFINAMTEGGGPGEAISVVQSHKDELQDCLRALARRIGHPHPARAAEEALVIVEGAIVRTQMTGDACGVAAITARLLARL
jgi:AcrR family transcriptional regulator